MGAKLLRVPAANCTARNGLVTAAGKSIRYADIVRRGALARNYTAEQLTQLADTLPSAEVLQWCKDNGYAVVAGSPTEMSLLDVRSAKSSLFYSKTEGWYASQPFAANEKVSCRWLAIRKTEVPNSLNKKWDAQQKLLSDVEQVPNAAEMSWFNTTTTTSTPAPSPNMTARTSRCLGRFPAS